MLTPSKQVPELFLSPVNIRALCCIVLFLSASTFATAQEPPQRGEHRGPPPEAFSACEALTESDFCTVQTRRGELTGQCRIDRRQEVLVCVPDSKRRPEKSEENKPPSDGPASAYSTTSVSQNNQ